MASVTRMVANPESENGGSAAAGVSEALLTVGWGAVNRVDLIATRDAIAIEYEEGATIDVEQHDGTVLRLRKIDPAYDPTDRIAAMNYVQHHHARGEVVTGLLYVEPGAPDLHQHLATVEAPFNTLGEAELCPGTAALERINATLR